MRKVYVYIGFAVVIETSENTVQDIIEAHREQIIHKSKLTLETDLFDIVEDIQEVADR